MVLSSDQFDILVKIINSAVTDSKTAMAILPVSTIMYRVRRGEGEGGGGGWCSAEWGSEGRGDASEGVSGVGVRV